MSSNTDTASPKMSSRPSVARSATMPAFRHALSMPSVEKTLSLSTKGLRRMSALCIPKPSEVSSSSTTQPSPLVECNPAFTTPEYATSYPPPSESISPLTRPNIKRAMTMPAPVRALQSGARSRLPTMKMPACEWAPRKASVESVESVSSVSTASTRRRSSSVSTVESFTSSEDQLTLGLRLRALPSTMIGVLTSILAVVWILLFPAMAAGTPKRIPAPRPYERNIIISEEQELNPPKLRQRTTASRISRRVAKTYRRTLRRVARARRTSTTAEALVTLFAPVPKRVRAATPGVVDPKTLVSEVPFVVYSSPISLPLPKGPAPVVRPARNMGTFSVLPMLKEEETVYDALCAGW
ncbi:hypothetical protein B0H17DRAFT_1198606 [Mycena rosella]|uniref:Uncharacterized protein n=1 Tax=Mycena rosella TaxID=1033263 RepID=A0AAD7DMM2_MYCRO|nr:hypothetical protein B0H17DRAFT_1198606 [Mycena rosella]